MHLRKSFGLKLTILLELELHHYIILQLKREKLNFLQKLNCMTKTHRKIMIVENQIMVKSCLDINLPILGILFYRIYPKD